jgi:hypothetical protein
MMTGWPERLSRRFTELEPGFVPTFHGFSLVVALALTAGWALVILRSDAKSPYRSVLYWACGSTLLWGLIMTLLLGWIDYGKSYRPVANSMATALRKSFPQGAACIESRGLGEPQRAVLDYHADIVTRRVEVAHDRRRAPACPVLLVQARSGDDDRRLGPGWKRIWEGNRPRDQERYRLYVRSR